MPTARFEADFSGFISAIDASKIALVNFNTGAQDVEKTLNAMTDQFSGRQIIQEASLMVVAIEKLGGVSTLTADELQDVGAKAQEAADKLRAMGSDVPEGIQKYADAAKNAEGATGDWSQAVGVLEQTMGALGISFSIASVVEFVKGIIEAAEQITNLAARLQISTDAVQDFQAVAEATGVPMTKLTSAMQTLQDKIGKDDTGLTALFAQLGLSMEAMKDQDLFTTFQQIATALDTVTDASQKAEDARVIFGNGWKQLLPAMAADVLQTTTQLTKMTPTAVKFFDELGKAAKNAETSIKNSLANIALASLGVNDNLYGLRDAMDAAAKSAKTVAPALPTFADFHATTMGMQDLIDIGNEMTTGLEGQLKVLDAYNKSLPGIALATDDWHARLTTLSPVVVQGAQDLLKLGASAKDVAGYYDLADTEIQAVTKDLKEQKTVADNLKTLSDNTLSYQQALDTLNGTVVEGANYYLALGKNVKDVAALYGVSVDAIQALKKARDDEKSGLDSLTKAQAAYNDYLAKTTEDATTYQINKIWEKVAEEEKAFKGSEDQRAAYTKIIEAMADAQTDAIVAAAYKETDGVSAALDKRSRPTCKRSLPIRCDPGTPVTFNMDTGYTDPRVKGYLASGYTIGEAMALVGGYGGNIMTSVNPAARAQAAGVSDQSVLPVRAQRLGAGHARANLASRLERAE